MAQADWYSVSTSKNWNISCDNWSNDITGTEIVNDDVSLESTLCAEDDLKLGGCIASILRYTVNVEDNEAVKGEELSVYVTADSTFQRLGYFYVDNIVLSSDKKRATITAYDQFTKIASLNVSDWYNHTYSSDDTTHYLGTLRNLFLTYLKNTVGFDKTIQTNLPNDRLPISKTISTNGELNALMMLRSICELNGGYGTINNDGLFEIVFLGITPSETRLLGNNVFLDTFDSIDIYDDADLSNYPELREVSYSDYDVKAVTCVTVKSSENDVGVTEGSDTSNPYIVSANFLTFGLTTEQLHTCANAILNCLEITDTYRPCKITCNGLPFLTIGSNITVHLEDDTITFGSYVVNRTLSGVQALKDVFESKGNEYRTNEVTVNDELIRSKGKSLEISKSNDGLEARLTNFETNVQSSFALLDGQIVLTIDANGNIAYTELMSDGTTTSYNVKADNISFDSYTFDLTTNDINITATNFEISSDGNLTLGNNIINTTDSVNAINVYNQNYSASITFAFQSDWSAIKSEDSTLYIGDENNPVELYVSREFIYDEFYCHSDAYFMGTEITIGDYDGTDITPKIDIKAEGGLEIAHSNSTPYIDFHNSESTNQSVEIGGVVYSVDYNNRIISGVDGDSFLSFLYSNGATYGYSNLKARSFVTDTSSRAVKENIKDISDERRNKILDVKVREFDYKDGWGKKDQVGVIVEEVAKIIPNSTDMTETWNPDNFDVTNHNQTVPGVNYSEFIPYLIAQVQENHKQIELLKKEIEVLKKGDDCK